MFVPDAPWLPEAYLSPIDVVDTGYVQRNIQASAVTAALIESVADPKGKFIDFGAGYGLLVRLMRDRGYDFYWKDKHATNLFARGFEWCNSTPAELITAFEVFEHLPNPRETIQELASLSDMVLFTTEVLPQPTPKLDDWWYFGLSHGQHVSFYGLRSLYELAAAGGYRCITDGVSWHLFTRRKIRGSVIMRAKRRSVQLVTKLLHPREGLQWQDHLRLEQRIAAGESPS